MTPDNANLFAFVVLLAWIPLAFLAFARFRPAVAGFLVVIGAELLLPVGATFSFRGLPDLGRGRIAALAALAACLLLHPSKIRPVLSNHRVLLLLSLLAISAVSTALTNADPVIQGVVVLPGMRPYDALSVFASQFLDIAVPFLLGVALYRSSRDLRFVHGALVVAITFYTIPVLYELRMSPQLHNMLYGYFPHSFIQHIRASGFRPLVFTPHGLVLSMLLASAVVLAVGLAKSRLRVWPGISPWPIAAYLFVILILSKSWAPVIYAVLGVTLLVLAPVRLRMLAAATIAAITLAYPALRTLDLVPTDQLVSAAGLLSEERAASLAVRFHNEERLLDRTHERIWFGWGGWGRNRIYDPVEGRDVTITDGMWIVTMSIYGVLGFATHFGLVLIPIWALWRGWRRIRSPTDRILLSSFALLLAIRSVDLIPNADLSPSVLLYAGAMLGLCSGIPAEERSRARSARQSGSAGRIALPARGATAMRQS